MEDYYYYSYSYQFLLPLMELFSFEATRCRLLGIDSYQKILLVLVAVMGFLLSLNLVWGELTMFTVLKSEQLAAFARSRSFYLSSVLKKVGRSFYPRSCSFYLLSVLKRVGPNFFGFYLRLRIKNSILYQPSDSSTGFEGLDMLFKTILGYCYQSSEESIEFLFFFIYGFFQSYFAYFCSDCLSSISGASLVGLRTLKCYLKFLVGEIILL